MEQYISKSTVVAEIEKRRNKNARNKLNLAAEFEDNYLLSFLDTLETKEVDLERLGEIARHLIAVKDHSEDMRLDKEEWLMLEKIGYPERFKAQKGE